MFGIFDLYWVVGFFGNLCLVLLMLGSQYWTLMPARHTIILGSNSQRFLYMQDWKTMMIGDPIAFGVINAIYFRLCLKSFSLPEQYACVFLVVIGMILFLMICQAPNHKPDSGFPSRGVVSPFGYIHAVYWGISASAVVMIIYAGAMGYVGVKSGWSFTLAFAFYLVCYWLDIAAGHFAKFEPAEDMRGVKREKKPRSAWLG